MARYPNEPFDSCPSIDKAIAEMEKIRKINQTLREDARDFYIQLEEKETELAIAYDRIKDLENDLQSAEKELEDMKKENA